MPAIAYPASLPCPAVSTTIPAERRIVSDLPGAKQFRRLESAYLAIERVMWNVLTQEQAEAFQAWWDSELRQGGAWFSAGWPSPRGGALLRRFRAPPQWDYIHGGVDRRMWRVSAECDVRGT